MQVEQREYVGFWARVLASLVDSILVLVILVPLLLAIYGREYLDPERTTIFAGPADVFLNLVAPAIAIVLFWIHRKATPGKMLIRAEVIDADTGAPLTVRQSIGRYLGYYVSTLPLLLGLIWVAFDPRKQGWHDKLAGTVVVRAKRGLAAGPLSKGL
jgi:uncharacterized RDD family membrane protein YckC